jgi:hypothetical protein
MSFFMIFLVRIFLLLLPPRKKVAGCTNHSSQTEVRGAAQNHSYGEQIIVLVPPKPYGIAYSKSPTGRRGFPSHAAAVWVSVSVFCVGLKFCPHSSRCLVSCHESSFMLD